MLKQAEALRSRNESMTLELSTSRSAARQLRDELAERAEENVDTLNQVCDSNSSTLSYFKSSACSRVLMFLIIKYLAVTFHQINHPHFASIWFP